MSHSSTLDDQLREMHGRVAYTHKTHEKMADGYVCRYKWIKNIEISLSSLATSSLILSILGDSKSGTILGAFLSTVLLALTLYVKEASLGEQAQKHTAVAAKLWGVREQLLSLLIDLHDGQPEDEVRRQRDDINKALEDIYKGAPRTDARAYAAAQRSLKSEEDLYFSDTELDTMLPKELRRTKL
jgi:hypothetical protein